MRHPRTTGTRCRWQPRRNVLDKKDGNSVLFFAKIPPRGARTCLVKRVFEVANAGQKARQFAMPFRDTEKVAPWAFISLMACDCCALFVHHILQKPHHGVPVFSCKTLSVTYGDSSPKVRAKVTQRLLLQKRIMPSTKNCLRN